MDLQNCVTYYKLRDFLGMEVHAPLKEIFDLIYPQDVT